jgi:acyl-CoA dehydrogenase
VAMPEAAAVPAGHAPPLAPSADPMAIALSIAQRIVAPNADSVDRESRFPWEGINALRDAKLLTALVPRDQGGLGLPITQVAEICQTLGQHCASTAMVFAMHQIQVACVVRHAKGSAYFDAYIRELVEKQLILASATSEVNVGGDVRTSICAVERNGESIHLKKRRSSRMARRRTTSSSRHAAPRTPRPAIR